jgi:energy-coupling factor transport system permease protein
VSMSWVDDRGGARRGVTPSARSSAAHTVKSSARTHAALASIHAGAWGVWLAAIVATLATTRNPLYMLFVLTWIGITTALARRVTQLDEEADGVLSTQAGGVGLSPVTFGLFVVTISAVFNALSVHIGQTVLFRLPRAWPLIGGPITLEAFVYGALNGLALTGLFAAFVLLNRVTTIRSLVRLAPRAFYPIAVVVTIAVTYVPSTVRQFHSIREAQAIRGHRIRGVRSWLPLIMPLLIGGMERALQLAEAMVARGFASGDTFAEQGGDPYTRGALIVGMASLLAGMLLHLVWRASLWGPLTLGIGALLIAWAIRRMSRGQRYTHYRPERWQGRDSVVVVGALITAVCFVFPVPGMARETVYFYPYPALGWPELDLGVGMSTWGLLGPAFILFWTLMAEKAAKG